MESNDVSTVYEELYSVPDEESSSVDDYIPDSETDEEDNSIAEEIEVDSDDVYTSSISEDESAFLTLVESTADVSEGLSDNDYLNGIYTNTTRSVVFEFVIILLLIITLFSRFLLNIIL